MHEAIQDVDLCVCNGTTNRNHPVLAFALASPGRHVYRRLCWTVEIMQLDIKTREEAFLQFKREGFATANDTLQARAVLKSRLRQEHLEHRRYKVERGDLLFSNQGDKVTRILVPARAGHNKACSSHQGPEKLPDRDIKAERRLLQNTIGRHQGIGLLHPVQAIANTPVYIHHALGLPCRARGVDHVHQIFGLNSTYRVLFFARRIPVRV